MQNNCKFMQIPSAPHYPGSSRAHDDRRESLRRIIRDGAVGRQVELVRLLKRAGFDVTQSSVSRDLRELGVAKVGDRYVLPEDATTPVADLRAVSAFVQQAIPAGPHLTVVRTTIGSAQSVALAIDRARWPEVVGTISGDDTIFIATDSARTQRALLERIRSLASR